MAMPFVKSAGKKALRAGLKTGVGLASDALRGKDMKTAVKRRVKRAVAETLDGAGMHAPVKRKKKGKRGAPIKRATKRRRVKRTTAVVRHGDIFD